MHISKKHSINVLGTKIIDPATIDPLGKLEREMKRIEKRRKKKSLFDDLF